MSAKILRLRSACTAVAFLFLSSAAALGGSGVLHAFKDSSAQHPETALVRDAAGNLYGTAADGGVGTVGGCGAVFKLAPNGSGEYAYTLLHQFQGYPREGCGSFSTLIIDSAGNLYGTTTSGGAHDVGVVFQLAPGTSGGYTYQTLYAFNKTGACAHNIPIGRLYLDSTGDLFGVTEEGGVHCAGSVFKLSPGLAGWTEQTLYSFSNVPDGAAPEAGLIRDSSGNFYGAAAVGGTLNGGAIYQLSPSSGGRWTERILYSFGSRGDGFGPLGELNFDSAGDLYGVTEQGGGTNYQGTVFELKPSPDGWAESILHRFKINSIDGYLPQSGVIFDTAGNLYGTTFTGGKYNSGVAYKLAPNGDGSYTESAVHVFTGGNDGANPYASLILDPFNNLYGTAYAGGKADNGNNAFGTVFVLAQQP